MIRDAQKADIGRMVDMGQRFRKDTCYDKYLRDNPERMAELCETLISKGTLIVSEKEGEIIGMLGFIIYPHFISGDIFAGEVFWWVEPEHRGEGLRLLKEMKSRARAAGAKFYQMIAPNESEAKVVRLYRRLGCELVESTYQGVL